MAPTKLHSSPRLDEADWVEQRLLPFGSGVGSIVPAGFPAYVRILHPASDSNGETLRWAEVAAKTGRVMHRLAQFHAINRPKTDIAIEINPPDPGRMPRDLLTSLCEVLARHTNTPQHCYFCMWEGHGWLSEDSGGTLVFTRTGAPIEPPTPAEGGDCLSPVLRAAVRSAPRLHFPYRSYILFEGPLTAATEFGWALADTFIAESPNLFWPQDHAWCAATEIDLFCTLIAGSEELAESLIGDERLEAWCVFADDPVHADSDLENA